MSSKPAPSQDLSFTMGIEEEYLVVDPVTRDLIREAPPDMMQKCSEHRIDTPAPRCLGRGT